MRRMAWLLALQSLTLVGSIAEDHAIGA